MRDNSRPEPPASFEALADTVESQPGIGFRHLTENLIAVPASQQACLEKLIATARGLTQEELVPPHVLVGWAAGIDKVVAAAHGDPEAKTLVSDHLAAYALTTRRTGLVDALRRIAAGHPDRGLLANRDPLETAILGSIFIRLDGLRPGRVGNDDRTTQS
jgi:hypothetical protein